MENATPTINGKPVNAMPCCGIFAAAMAADVEPQIVFDAYKAEYNLSGRWKGVTHSKNLRDLMRKKFGVNVDVEYMMSLNKRETDKYDAGNRTIRKWYNDHAIPSATYIVQSRGHIFTVKEGRYIDQWHNEPVEQAKGSRAKVLQVWRILNARKAA